MKGFLHAYNRFTDQVAFIPNLEGNDTKDGKGKTPAFAGKSSAMFLVDSDFDTEDEQYGDDIEEIISNRVVNSVLSDDEAQLDRIDHGEDFDNEDDDKEMLLE